MEFFRIRRTIPFMRYSLILNAISFITFIVAVGFLIFRGLNLSVEFTGGTLMEVSYQQPPTWRRSGARSKARAGASSRCRTSAPRAMC